MQLHKCSKMVGESLVTGNILYTEKVRILYSLVKNTRHLNNRLIVLIFRLPQDHPAVRMETETGLTGGMDHDKREIDAGDHRAVKKRIP